MSIRPILDSKIYNYHYFQQDDVCRLCWSKNAFKNIVDISSDNMAVNTEFLHKINECVDVDLGKYNRPNRACDDCFSQINKFHSFRKFCQETDRKLREIIENHQNNKDTAENDAPLDETRNITEYLDSLPSDGENEFNNISKVKTWKYKLKRTATYCNICRLDFKNVDKYNIHNSQEHGIESGQYKCFGCEKRFKNRKTRLGHEINFCKSLKKGYECGICNRFLPRRGMYETHMRDHRKNVPIKLANEIFKCKKCEELFDSNESLLRHIADHEIDKKNYVCEMSFVNIKTKLQSCGRVFTRKDYLHKHKLTHTGEKQHICPHCGFRTIQRSSLTVHIRKHTGERPYKCSVCPQRCISSSNLRAHQQRHLGLKIHECTICNKKFGYKISLKEHMSTHAPSSYSCDHCNATYSRLRGLRRHLLTKHGEKKTS